MQILPNWHPLLVHFTVALYSVATLLLILPLLFKGARWIEQSRTVAMWCLWIGAGFTVLTVASGWYAFNTVNHDTESHIVMLEHRRLAITTFVLFIILAGLSYYKSKQGQQMGWVFALAMLIASGVMISTAWHGAELVYRYGLGVMSLPNKDKHAHAEGEHSHDHAVIQQGETAHQHDATHSHDNAHAHVDEDSNTAVMESDEHGHDAEAHEHAPASQQQTDSEAPLVHQHADGSTHVHE